MCAQFYPQADQVFSENGIKFTFHVFQFEKKNQ